MPRIEQTSVYNSRILQMLPTLRARWVCFALVLFAQLAFASDWRKPAAQLAAKISSASGPGVIALDIVNRSSLPAADVEQIRQILVSELANSGVRVWQSDQAGATAKVTLSENLQSYVWVAEVQQGSNEPTLAMVTEERVPSVSTQNAPQLLLRSTMLFAEPRPILDAVVVDQTHALRLSASGVMLYSFRDNRWIPSGSVAGSLDASQIAFPRDLRGRLVLNKGNLFDAYLPGVVCHGADPGFSRMTCAQTDDPWLLATTDFGVSGFFSPARNFFTGVLAPGIGKQKSGPPFYSAAAVLKANYVLWILSGTDGQVHLLDGINQQITGKLQWGSDIAAIRTPCRPDWFVVATSQEEDEDSLQAFEFPDREPVAVSQKLQLNGPVTALWTQQNGDSITAVYRNSDTGNYEALQITLACNQ